MRIPPLTWLVLLLAAEPAVRGAEQAAARLFCLSLQFQPVTQGFGVESLSFSTGSPDNPPNGELRPLFMPGMPSHGSSFLLVEPDIGTVQGSITLDVPVLPDTTGDGFSDFFKTAKAVATT